MNISLIISIFVFIIQITFSPVVFAKGYDMSALETIQPNLGTGYYGSFYLIDDQTIRVNRRHQNQLENRHVFEDGSPSSYEPIPTDPPKIRISQNKKRLTFSEVVAKLDLN